MERPPQPPARSLKAGVDGDGGEGEGPIMVAQFQVVKIGTFWNQYKRIFQVTTTGISTVDPSTFKVTNFIEYNTISSLVSDESSTDQFTFVVSPANTSFCFKSPHRTLLLCQLMECATKAPSPSMLFTQYGPFKVQRMRKSRVKSEGCLSVASYGLVEQDKHGGKVLQIYKFQNISRYGTDENSRVIFFVHSDRIKLFVCGDLPKLVDAIMKQLRLLGICQPTFHKNQNANEIFEKRKIKYEKAGSAISTFDVNKFTKRNLRPVPRQLHVSEGYIVEKDASGFQSISLQKLSSIYAIVRTWSNPREFTIEYVDGSCRTYTTGVRDSLLALLLDVCHAGGNTRVVVTGEVSDKLRLMPRFTEEKYEASLKDAFFGSDSIEVWYLKKVGGLVKVVPMDIMGVVLACRELNANVPVPGIDMASELMLVRTCLSGVLIALNDLLAAAYKNVRLANIRGMVVLLQTLCRIIPCACGYKAFVETEEIDTRILLLHLIRYDDDFVNYWSLEVLSKLCICPFNSRNTQQEFVNKHTLLTDSMLTNLVELMSTRIDTDEDREEYEKEENNAHDGQTADTDGGTTEGMDPERLSPSMDPEGEGVELFFPNSLVIVTASALLESIVSSKRDTSSPELMNKVFDLLSTRVEILIHMLRSTSFLIMENAAILMHLLLKNRKNAAEKLRDAALSDCLVLKHFYNGVFSPSSSQRFISRFLVASWTAGGEENSGKKLLRRIIPSGLVEYLKYGAISDEHKQTLDEIDEEFYSRQGSMLDNSRTSISPGDQQKRMRARILAVMRDPIVPRGNSNNDEEKRGDNLPASQLQENYRIMFHVMTQDHNLPDLIWNEHTRLELRSSLEAELNEFENEQRLRGIGKVAWNYQQFSVRYESLNDELKVGSIYIRHFLEADDAFIKTLQNPSHVVLFEKLLRRMFLNIERNPSLAILCARCLSRLYRVCNGTIGTFDDMMIMIRMLEEVTHLELQHSMFDFLEQLTIDESNLEQLLDREFVDVAIKYCSLAHLNPDQIGNMLARATNCPLLIKDGRAGGTSATGIPADATTVQDTSSEEQKINRMKRSLWVPEDEGCPKIWFVAEESKILPPPSSSQSGPYRVSELIAMLDEGKIMSSHLAAPYLADDYDDSSAYEAVVDTGLWKPISEYFQLRMQMVFPGKAVYSPAEVASKAISMLNRVAAVHRSVNSRSIPFHPIPESKRIMSDPEHLSIFAQLLLSNDRKVVETAADLLRSLIQFNIQANSKLYLTGAFFFACRYTGNNFGPIAKLFHVSHLHQSFLDSSTIGQNSLPIEQRSILGNIIPPAVINILENYGPERFTAVFTGEFDTPEVIWGGDLRKQVVDMINQHLGDFESRLKQYTLGKYEYCPIPKIHLSLDKEIYCHEYYLRNLCDETRFPDWPIVDPLALLREALEMWRGEMSKGIVDSDTQAAKDILGLTDKYHELDLRKAYKNLARKYHPDKNPNGREMFEKIFAAYELLCSIDMDVCDTDLLNVFYLIKTQNIIYRRFTEQVGNQKYPAYSLLVSVLTVPESKDNGITDANERSGLLVEGVKLMYHTCMASPLNGFEFVKSGCVVKLYDLVKYAIKLNELEPSTRVPEISREILLYGMKAFSVVASLEPGRTAIEALCPEFACDMITIINLSKQVPLASENCLQLISQCAALNSLQNTFIAVGIVWKLVPMLLAFDETLDEEAADESQRSTYNQHALNQHAILSARVLGRLGGYMHDDLATEKNIPLQEALSVLLTEPLAKLLRNANAHDLLRALNDNVEKATKIWNLTMRNEVLAFVRDIDNKRGEGFIEHDLNPSKTFSYSTLKNELCIESVYVRIFNKTGEVVDIDDPAEFCRALLEFLWKMIQNPPAPGTVELEHLNQAIEAVRILTEFQSYIPLVVAKSENGVKAIFGILEFNTETVAFSEVAQLFGKLGTCNDFIHYTIDNNGHFLWQVLKCFCCGEGKAMTHIWASLEGFCSIPEGLETFLNIGLVFRLLSSIMGLEGYRNSFQNRAAAANLLSKCLWNPIKGDDASAMLRRFLPEPLVVQLKKKQGAAILKVFDDVVETPETVWTTEMQGELRKALMHFTTVEDRTTDIFSIVPIIPPDYSVYYRQLADELFLGNVYVRLFLKQPTFRLTNTIYFLEKLVEYWESALNAQIQSPGSTATPTGTDDHDRNFQIVIGKENFLSLVTSCIVCVIKAETSVVDHIISWGFLHRLMSFLSKALDGGRRGSPVTSVVRILHQLVTRPEVLDDLATSHDEIMYQIMRVLDVNNVREMNVINDSVVTLPTEATLVVELLKKIFRCTGSSSLAYFVQCAMYVKMPQFLLDHIIGASMESLQELRNSSALKIYAVDALKNMTEVCDEETAAVLRALLDAHPSWHEYRGQSHDLFITNKEKEDVFLLEDASEQRFIGLLTDGSEIHTDQQANSQTRAHTTPSVFTSSGNFRAADEKARRMSQAAFPASSASVRDGAMGSPIRKATMGHESPIKQEGIQRSQDLQLSGTSGSNGPENQQKRKILSSLAPAPPMNNTSPAQSLEIPPPSPQVDKSASQSQQAVASSNFRSPPQRELREPSNIVQFTTTVVRGEYGLGLDLEKIHATGGASVKRIKEMPSGIMNPALAAYPPIKVEDVIVGVNGKRCTIFAEVVKEIRASEGSIELTIERKQ